MARNWDGLSEGYRHRLERHGITRNDYEAGLPLSGARGHGLTRSQLVNEIQGYKADLFGDRRKWNENRSRKNIDYNSGTGRKRTVAELKAVLKGFKESRATAANRGDWMASLYDQLREDDLEDAGFYH